MEEAPTNLAQGLNLEAPVADQSAREEIGEGQGLEATKSDGERPPESPSPVAPVDTATPTETDLDASTSSEALSNMADSLTNLAETSPAKGTSSAIRKMASTLYALAQANTNVTNQALEKMADSLASIGDTQSEEQSTPQASNPQESEEGTCEPTESIVSQLTSEVVEEIPAVSQIQVQDDGGEETTVATASIAEIIATTSEEPVLPERGGDDGLSEAQRQAEALANLVSQEDIVRIANSLASLAGKQGMAATTEIDNSDVAATAEAGETVVLTEGQEIATPAKTSTPIKRAAMDSPGVSSLDSTEILPPASKRRSYESDFKLEVVAYAARTSKNEASRRYMVDRKRILDWTRQKDALEASLNSGVKRKRLEGGGRKAKHPEIEEAVAEWVRSRWAKQEVVSREMIKHKARQIYRESYDGDDFSASEGWLNRFMVRHGISLRGSQSPNKTKSPAQRLAGKQVVSVQLPWIIDLEPTS